jgi:hypothetical protein
LATGIAFTGTVSTAQDKNGLKGRFKYVSGGYVANGGGATGVDDRTGERVFQVEGGAGPGFEGTFGESNTAVSGYIFEWCGLRVCNIFNSTR